MEAGERMAAADQVTLAGIRQGQVVVAGGVVVLRARDASGVVGPGGDPVGVDLDAAQPVIFLAFQRRAPRKTDGVSAAVKTPAKRRLFRRQ